VEGPDRATADTNSVADSNTLAIRVTIAIPFSLRVPDGLALSADSGIPNWPDFSGELR
jgi:hypothetical protein